MAEELNPNAITASVLTDLIKSSFEGAVSGITGKFSVTWRKIFEDFDPFMRESYQKNRYIRILCKKDQDVDLYDVYVKSYFSCNGSSILDDSLIYKIRDGGNVVVVGNGGAGKTCFMRHLWLTILANPQGITPLFLELRKMNELTSVNLKTFIRASISRTGLPEDVFSHFCKNGRFCFILDGFDEIIQSRQPEIDAQITDLAAEFPDCAIVVSSRDDRRFAGWQNFDVYDSDPLTLEQSRQLIKKVPFHDETKKLFLKQLTPAFFDKNKTFLENPLLTVMMLMTFKDNMETPNSLTIFYDQALSTLHQWHDSTKSFKREKTLDIDQFRKYFGMFCLISYYKQMFEFTVSEISEIILSSNKANGYTFSVEDILWDYEKAVNLIRQDGLMYVFIHRSFQEYFAALAMTRIVSAKFKDFLPLVLARTSDSVLQLCFELDRDLVVRNFVGDALDYFDSVGLRKNNIATGFRTLERAGVNYLFTMRRDKGKYHPLSIGFPTSQKVTNVFSNCVRLLKSEGIPAAEIYEPLFDSPIVESYSVIAEVATAPVLRVRFEGGEIVVETSDDRHDVWRLADAKVRERVLTFTPEFERHNREMAARFREIVRWGKGHLDALDARGQSLDQILNL